MEERRRKGIGLLFLARDTQHNQVLFHYRTGPHDNCPGFRCVPSLLTTRIYIKSTQKQTWHKTGQTCRARSAASQAIISTGLKLKISTPWFLLCVSNHRFLKKNFFFRE